MSVEKRKEFYGPARPGTELLCGFDGGHDNGPICGVPATVHVWPGTPPDTRMDGIVFACDKHFAVIRPERIWDYHRIAGACGIPGARWLNGPEQGTGLCRHDMEEDSLDISAIIPELALAEGRVV